MQAKIKELRERFRSAKTDAEINAIDAEMKKLSGEHGFENAFVADMKQRNEELKELELRQKLQHVLPVISISYLARNYFNKTPQWFYQRLNGNVVNGKPATFNDSEIATLRTALSEISNEINRSVAFLI
jgi:hypothetical protein